MSDRRAITAPDAPAPAGPYVHAITTGSLLFCSGQVALDPATGSLVEGSMAEQAARCLENLDAVCRAAGTRLSRAVRTTIYLTEVATFAEVNGVYEQFFDGEPPARVTIGVAALPLAAKIEMDAIVTV